MCSRGARVSEVSAGRYPRRLYNRRGIAQNPAKWLTPPHSALMRLPDRCASYPHTFIFQGGTCARTNTAVTRTQPARVHVSRPEGWGSATVGRSRRRGNAHTHTQTCTLTWSHSAGRLSQKSSQRIEFSQKSFQSKGRWRRAELIIPDISGSERVSYNNNYCRLLSICSVGQVRCLGRASGWGGGGNTRDEVSVEILKRVTRPAAAAIFETLPKSQRPPRRCQTLFC